MGAEPTKRSLDGLNLALVVGTAVFGVLALLNAWSSTMSGIDLAIAGRLHRVAVGDPHVTSALMIFTDLGAGLALVLLTAVGAVWLVFSKRHVLSAGVALSMIGVGALNSALKLSFHRPRPSFVDPVLLSNGWSFPSGHSMGTTVAIGLATYIAADHVQHPRRRRAMFAAAGAWVLLMGFSRLYLGAHYFSDVVGGLAAGLAWLAISIKIIERVSRRPVSS